MSAARYPQPVPFTPGVRYFNRELSLLAFHERVLALAEDRRIPLLERLRFLCISCTNLDEFFEVRVARLKHAIEIGASKKSPDGLTAEETLVAIHERVTAFARHQYDVFQKMLVPEMEAEGIRILQREHWSPSLRDWLRGYFQDSILPVLSPVGLDPARPFPHLVNKSLNFIVSVEGADALHRQTRLAVVQAPRSLPRLVRLPAELGEGVHTFVFLASLIRAFVGDIFPGMQTGSCHQFRVTRNSDLYLEGEDFDDLLSELSGRLADRRFAAAVRLEIGQHCDDELTEYLCNHLGLGKYDIYRVAGAVNLNRLLALHDLVDRPDLKYAPYRPKAPPSYASPDQLFARIERGDAIAYHPFESFNHVLNFLEAAATDPDVLAIKQTLYRTGADSPVVDLLVEAADAGKEVTVVIELRARFDEAANIALASRLHDAGAHVIYGPIGFKTHAKMLMVVRRKGKELKRYVHLSTGNYHVGNARSYTDYSYFTADPEVCEDVHAVFLQLTGLTRAPRLKKIIQAPFHLHNALIDFIRRETDIAARGGQGKIIAKSNALLETEVMDALYEASAAGVSVDLIVRGICCLRPGVPGRSDNIRVRSILGRFLEHSRLFYFGNDGSPDILMASADWMDRNFFRRIEIAFPITDPLLQRRLYDELQLYLRDNADAWELDGDGHYTRLQPAPGEHAISAQQQLSERYAAPD